MRTTTWCLLLTVLLLGATPAAAEEKCPASSDERLEGHVENANANFMYVSWATPPDQDGARVFHRCVENRAKSSLWNHWKVQVLAPQDTPANDRNYASTRLPKAEPEDRRTTLWWGNQKNNKENPKARCDKADSSCKEDNASSASRLPEIIPVQFPSTQPPTVFGVRVTDLFKRGKHVEVLAYHEVFVPVDPQDLKRGVMKAAVSLRTIVTAAASVGASGVLGDVSYVMGFKTLRFDGIDEPKGVAEIARANAELVIVDPRFSPGGGATAIPLQEGILFKSRDFRNTPQLMKLREFPELQKVPAARVDLHVTGIQVKVRGAVVTTLPLHTLIVR